MAASDDELTGVEKEEFGDEDVDLSDDADLEDDDGDGGEEALEEEEEEEDESSLDELLTQRAAARRAGGDEDDEEEMLAVLSEEPEIRVPAEIVGRIVPVKDRKEFVCRRCYLVKARSQLADAERQLCRDCV